MAHYSTEWHGPSSVTNDLSDIKGDYGLLSTVRRLWYRNTDSSSAPSDLTNAIEGTAAATGSADIDEYAITSNLEVVSGVSDYTAYLRSSDFRFNIPAEATIVGVKIRWKGQSTSESDQVMDHHVYMLVDGSYSLATEAGETTDDQGPDGTGSDAGFQSTSDGAWSVHPALAFGSRQFTTANSEYFNIASNSNLQTGATDFAFSMWVYPDTSTGGMTLVSKYTGSTGTSEYYVELNTSLKVVVRLSAASEEVVTSSGSLTEDAWNHVVVEHDNGTGIRVTINGGVTETLALTGGNTEETVDFRVGSRSGSSVFLNGRLSRLGFWKKVLSSAELTQLYNDGVGLAYAALDDTLQTSLISYWNLDEASGNAIDSHTNGYDLIDNNTVTAEGGPLDYELRQTTGSSDEGSLGGYPINQLTPAKVNSSNFGFVLSAQKERDNPSAPWWNNYTGSPQHPSLEHTRMRVWYDITTPGSGNMKSSILSNWSGGLNSSYSETLWDPTGNQNDGAANTGDTARWFQAAGKRHFTIADNADMRTGGSFAFSIWVYPNSASGTHHMLSKYAGSGANCEYTLSRAAGNLTMRMDAYTRLDLSLDPVEVLGETTKTTTTGELFTTGQWTHLVIDHNGTEMRLYSNGKYIESLMFPEGNDPQAGDFCLGRRCAAELYTNDYYTKLGFWKSAGKGALISGSVPELRHPSGFLLGQNNVDVLYNGGLGLRYNSLPESLKGGLIGYWNLNEAGTVNGVDSHGSNPLIPAGDSLPSDVAGPVISSDYVTKTLATTSLKPTLHLGSRNEYVAAGREQSL
jgi:hypothetical protein